MAPPVGAWLRGRDVLVRIALAVLLVFGSSSGLLRSLFDAVGGLAR